MSNRQHDKDVKFWVSDELWEELCNSGCLRYSSKCPDSGYVWSYLERDIEDSLRHLGNQVVNYQRMLDELREACKNNGVDLACMNQENG